jgi:hypothetical protein
LVTCSISVRVFGRNDEEEEDEAETEDEFMMSVPTYDGRVV